MNLREEALPSLLGGLQTLPVVLSELYRARLGESADERDRAQARFLERVLPLVGYTEDDTADQLQAQLAPWLGEVAGSEALLDEVVEALRGGPPALQEALHWCFSFEAASTQMNLAGGIRTAEVHATFVPFICTGYESEARTGASPFAGPLADQTVEHGLVHPDELLLVVPFFLTPRALTSLSDLTRLLTEAWEIAAHAWGPGLVPSVQAQAHWEAQWTTRPLTRRWHAPPYEPGDLRFAMLVVVSPELHAEQQVPLEPWQRLEREQMRLRDRFAPETHRIQTESEELLEAATDARVLWADALIEALDSAGYPAMVGGDPRDAYSALALAATNAAVDLVGEAEIVAGNDEPLVLLVDAAGMSVELAGERRTLPWAPRGALMPGMVRALAVRLSRAVGRAVNLSVALEREGWALIQSQPADGDRGSAEA